MAGELYNLKCAGVKRLMQEAREFCEPTEMYFAQPLEENLFEWHFTVRGALDTDFDGGIYHGRILFPPEYPMKPPNIVILTPNGRFELNKKICLSISGYHPETWLPSWSIRTALLALIGFMPTSGAGALGSLEYPAKERKRLANLSINWKCDVCNCTMKDVLLPLTEKNNQDNSPEGNLGAFVEQPSESLHDSISIVQLLPNDDATNDVDRPEVDGSDQTEPSQTANTMDLSEGAEIRRRPLANISSVPNSTTVSVPSPQSHSSANYKVLLVFPVCVVAFSFFAFLLARRILSHKM